MKHRWGCYSDLEISQWRREKEVRGHAGLLTGGIEHHQKVFVFLLQKPSQLLVNEPKKIKTDLYPKTPLIICVTTLKVNMCIHIIYAHLSEGRGVIFPNRQDLSIFSLLNFNLKEDGKICYRFEYLLNILEQYLHCWDVEVAWLGFFSLQNLWLETFSSLTHPKSHTLIQKVRLNNKQVQFPHYETLLELWEAMRIDFSEPAW